MATINEQIARLIEIKTANYRRNGDAHPEIAAQFAVEGIMAMYRHQPQFIEQLLNEEIEDAIRAGRQIQN